MELYILRHGIAEDASAGQADSERALTAEGKRRLRAILKSAAAAGVAPALIITSPYLRAVQTAQEAAQVLRYSGELLRTKALVPGSSPQAVWDEVRVHRIESQVLLTGHEPLLSSAAAFLLGCPELRIEFKKGTLARIDMDRFGPAPQGVLKWLLAPKVVAAK